MSLNRGEVQFNSAEVNTPLTPGSYDYLTFIHEIGHALGLSHPYDSPLWSGINRAETVMSYNQSNPEPTSFMKADIVELQHLYGTNMSNLTDTVYTLGGFFNAPATIWDAGGTDTIDLSASADNQVINLNSGERSGVYGIYIGYDVEIENAIGGTAQDEIIH